MITRIKAWWQRHKRRRLLKEVRRESAELGYNVDYLSDDELEKAIIDLTETWAKVATLVSASMEQANKALERVTITIREADSK